MRLIPIVRQTTNVLCGKRSIRSLVAVAQRYVVTETVEMPILVSLIWRDQVYRGFRRRMGVL